MYFDQRMGAPIYFVIFLSFFFHFLPLVQKNTKKLVLTQKQIILTSKQHAGGAPVRRMKYTTTSLVQILTVLLASSYILRPITWVCVFIVKKSSNAKLLSRCSIPTCPRGKIKKSLFYSAMGIWKVCLWTRTTWVDPQISKRGRYSNSNIKQQLTICQQILKTWCIRAFFAMLCQNSVHL